MALTALHDFRIDLHAIAFQEVGRVSEDDPHLPIHVSECEGYVVLTAKPSAYFRHLALGLDIDCFADWCSGQVGHSLFSCAVQIPPFQKGVCLVTAHLPHQGRPLDDFLAALSSLEACLTPMVRKHHPIVVLGDLNVDLCQGSGARLTALLASFHKLGLLHFSKDAAPTWGTHRLDHLVCNSLVVDTCRVFPCQTACVVEVRPDLKQALSVDHCCMSC